jgi:hypothetical protein
MLETEREFFRAHCEDWMDNHHGEFALVKGEELVGFFEDETTAIAEGGHRFENEDYLVRRVDRHDHEEASAPALSLGILRDPDFTE